MTGAALDTSSPLAWLSTLISLVGTTLSLRPDGFRALESSTSGQSLALAVLLLAGASQALGQSVALFFNRVSRRRFLVAQVVGSVRFTLTALLWIGAAWLPARLFAPDPPSFAAASRVIGLAYAPLLFGFLELAPYAGPFLARVLRIWTLLAAIVGITVVFGVRPGEAALVAGLGFLLQWLVVRFSGDLPARLERWLWRVETGRSERLEPSQLLEQAPGPRPTTSGER